MLVFIVACTRSTTMFEKNTFVVLITLFQSVFLASVKYVNYIVPMNIINKHNVSTVKLKIMETATVVMDAKG